MSISSNSASPRARHAAVCKRLSSVHLVYGATRHELKSASEIFQRTRRVPRTARVDLRASAPDVTEAELDERSHRKATIHCRKRLNDGRIDEQASGERENIHKSCWRLTRIRWPD